jgi:hypothetical protein
MNTNFERKPGYKYNPLACFFMWGFAFLMGAMIYGVVEMFLNTSPANPDYVDFRKEYSGSESSGEYATAVNLTFSEVRDRNGNVVMQGSSYIILCPGDSIDVVFSTPGNGHIMSFNITDPESGELLAVAYPSKYGDEVQKSAKVTIHIPENTTSESLILPWVSEIFIIQENEDSNSWFNIVKQVSLSNSLTLQLTSPENRDDWILKNAQELYPSYFRFLAFAFVCIVLLVLLRRKFQLMTSTLAIFAGSFMTFMLVFSEDLIQNGLLFVLTLVIIAVMIAILIINIKKYHPGLRFE